MSAINTLLANSERVLLASGHGDSFVVLSGAARGIRFVARYDVETPIELSTELGIDPRMSGMLRILPPAPPGLRLGDVVSDGAHSYRVIKREDNTASITIDFQVEQQLQ